MFARHCVLFFNVIFKWLFFFFFFFFLARFCDFNVLLFNASVCVDLTVLSELLLMTE